jgi:hypothetical protein
LRDSVVDEKIILKWSLRNSMWKSGVNVSGSRYDQLAGSLEHGNELLGSIICRKFLNQTNSSELSSRRPPLQLHAVVM